MNLAYTNKTPAPWLKTVAARAAKIASGANAMTYRVILRMTAAISSIASISRLTFVPKLEAAAPKSTENTTICSTSLLAMACTMELGMMCSSRSLSCSGPAAIEPGAAADAVRPNPGLNSWTATTPMAMEIIVATTNQPKALAPILAIEAAPSIRATPTTSVENTNGAMIILMRRKKLVVTSDRPAAALSAPGPAPRVSCRNSPNNGPAIMAMTTNHVRRDFMMYF